MSKDAKKRTNLDVLLDPDSEYEIGEVLCNLINYDAGCEHCPFGKFCTTGHIGTTTWLHQEVNPAGIDADFR